MKICIIAPNFLEPHSWMVSAYKTAKLLKNNGYEVVVITSKTKDSKKFENIDGIKVHRIPCFFIGDPFNYTVTPFLSYHLIKLIKREKPDKFLVNKYMFYTSLSVFLLKLLGKKVIMQTDTFPGINWFGRSKLLNFCLIIYANTLGRLILKLSDVVIVLHEGLISTSKKLKINYKVIHNGVDFKKYQVKGAKDILEYKGRDVLITYVGRLDGVKGFDILLKVASRNPSWKFLFVCGDKHSELREKLDKKHPNVKFEGFRTDVPTIMNASDIYVLPSFAEGLPNTLMEAMASGCAAVASDVGGVKVLIKNGKNGFLVKPGDYLSIEKKINELIKDSKKRKEFGDKSREIIKKDFSFDSIIKKWKEVL